MGRRVKLDEDDMRGDGVGMIGRISSRSGPLLVAPTLAVVTMLLLAVACSSDGSGTDSSTPAATSASAAVDGCAELAALETSLEALSNVEPLQDGLNALESALADSKTKLTAAASAASETLRPSVEDVQTAIDQLQSALQGVTSSDLAASATAIGTALAGVGSAATNLKSTLSQDCPGG